jgi:hypothetical protein
VEIFLSTLYFIHQVYCSIVCTNILIHTPNKWKFNEGFLMNFFINSLCEEKITNNYKTKSSGRVSWAETILNTCWRKLEWTKNKDPLRRTIYQRYNDLDILEWGSVYHYVHNSSCCLNNFQTKRDSENFNMRLRWVY